jgi:hypothetical protein
MYPIFWLALWAADQASALPVTIITSSNGSTIQGLPADVPPFPRGTWNIVTTHNGVNKVPDEQLKGVFNGMLESMTQLWKVKNPEWVEYSEPNTPSTSIASTSATDIPPETTPTSRSSTSTAVATPTPAQTFAIAAGSADTIQQTLKNAAKAPVGPVVQALPTPSASAHVSMSGTVAVPAVNLPAIANATTGVVVPLASAPAAVVAQQPLQNAANATTPPIAAVTPTPLAGVGGQGIPPSLQALAALANVSSSSANASTIPSPAGVTTPPFMATPQLIPTLPSTASYAAAPVANAQQALNVANAAKPAANSAAASAANTVQQGLSSAANAATVPINGTTATLLSDLPAPVNTPNLVAQAALANVGANPTNATNINTVPAALASIATPVASPASPIAPTVLSGTRPVVSTITPTIPAGAQFTGPIALPSNPPFLSLGSPAASALSNTAVAVPPESQLSTAHATQAEATHQGPAVPSSVSGSSTVADVNTQTNALPQGTILADFANPFSWMVPISQGSYPTGGILPPNDLGNTQGPILNGVSEGEIHSGPVGLKAKQLSDRPLPQASASTSTIETKLLNAAAKLATASAALASASGIADISIAAVPSSFQTIQIIPTPASALPLATAGALPATVGSTITDLAGKVPVNAGPGKSAAGPQYLAWPQTNAKNPAPGKYGSGKGSEPEVWGHKSGSTLLPMEPLVGTGRFRAGVDDGF